MVGTFVRAGIKKFISKVKGPSIEKRKFDATMTQFEKLLEKRGKEKIKTGKFDRFGNPSK